MKGYSTNSGTVSSMELVTRIEKELEELFDTFNLLTIKLDPVLTPSSPVAVLGDAMKSEAETSPLNDKLNSISDSVSSFKRTIDRVTNRVQL